nr:hypothetical protein [Pontibacter korlensis]
MPEGSDFTQRLVRDGQHDQGLSELLLQGVELVEGFDAGGAPGGPEVEQQQLSFEV